MSAIDILKKEHRSIKRFLNVLRVTCEKFEKGEMPVNIFGEILDLLLYVDSHIVKEEMVYSSLKSIELPEKKDPRILGMDDWYMLNIVILGDIKYMLTDHKERLRISEEITVAIENYTRNKDSNKKILRHLNLYIYLMFMHLLKEDRTIYPRLNHVFSAEKQKGLVLNFKEIENRILGKESTEYLKLINNLENKLGIVHKEENKF